MSRKKIVGIVVGASAVVLFVAISIARYCLVVEPQAKAEAEASAAVASEEQSSGAAVEGAAPERGEGRGMGDMSGYPAQEQEMILYMAKHRWVSTKGDVVLTFTADSMTVQSDGSAPESHALDPGEYLSVRDDGALGAADGEVMAASVDESSALFYLRLKDLSEIDVSALPPVVPDGSGNGRVYALTSTFLDNRIFVPVEEVVLQIDAGRELEQVVGDDLASVEDALRGLCGELYPTATKAEWAKTAAVDYDSGVYAFYFSLDDTTLAEVTVLYRRSDSTVQARSGVCSDFDEVAAGGGALEEGRADR